METTFILSQIIFYFVASVAIIAIGIFFSIAIYHLAHIIKELRSITHDFHNLTAGAKERISNIIERLSSLPILSFLSRRTNYKKTKKHEKK
ncbi:MAG: hypothetical protein ACYC1K_03060 [Minisyncoccota bacterium]